MSKEAMKLALETCEGIVNADWRKWDELASPEEFERWVKSRANHMAAALREALAEQPAQRKPWVGLTDEDIKEAEWLLSAIKEHEAYTLQEQLLVEGVDVFARAIEAKLKEKNA